MMNEILILTKQKKNKIENENEFFFKVNIISKIFLSIFHIRFHLKIIHN